MTYEEMLEQFEVWSEELDAVLDEYESLKLIEETCRDLHGEGEERRLSDDEELWLDDMYGRIEDRLNKAEFEVESLGARLRSATSLYADEELAEMVEFAEEAAWAELGALGFIEFETGVPWHEWVDAESADAAFAVAEDERLLEWLM